MINETVKDSYWNCLLIYGSLAEISLFLYVFKAWIAPLSNRRSSEEELASVNSTPGTAVAIRNCGIS